MDHGCLILHVGQQTALFEAIIKFYGIIFRQGNGDRLGYRVGVGVQQLTFAVVRDGRQHQRPGQLQQTVQPYLVDIADKAEVDRRVIAFVRPDAVGVGAAQPRALQP